MTVKELDEEDFRERVVGSGVGCFVFFWASWCTACKSMETTIEELSKEVNDVEFFEMNVDRNREIADEYNIRGVPAYLLFKGGELVDRDIAAKTKNQLKEMIKEAKEK